MTKYLPCPKCGKPFDGMICKDCYAEENDEIELYYTEKYEIKN